MNKNREQIFIVPKDDTARLINNRAGHLYHNLAALGAGNTGIIYLHA